MTDWTQPTLTSLYADVLNALKARDEDAARQFDPAYVTSSGMVTGTIRWNSTSNKWEQQNSSGGWDLLSNAYDINVTNLDGQTGAYYRAWSNLTGVPATFPPSAHTHDDRYFTETESDARFAASLGTSGNSLLLKSKSGGTLTTLTVPYATSAGNAGTVNGKQVNQNLRTTDAVTFAAFTGNGNAQINGILSVDGEMRLYDSQSATWRSLKWDNTNSIWTVEDSGGANQAIFHKGYLPAWGDVTGKPANFAPSPHGHAFDGTYRLQIRNETAGTISGTPGVAGELIRDTSNNRLYLMNGSSNGGIRIARYDEIPSSPDLSPYARKDQANTFTQNQTINGNLTLSANLSAKAGTFSDSSAAAAAKTILTMAGDSAALAVRNHASGSYLLLNTGSSHSIEIGPTAGAVKLNHAGTTRLETTSGGATVTGTLKVGSSTVWHAGNVGSGSGLDADKLDGQEGTYYRNASNLNAGTVAIARIPTATLAEAQAGTSTSKVTTPANVKAHFDKRITISASAPSGGDDGDLWFQV